MPHCPAPPPRPNAGLAEVVDFDEHRARRYAKLPRVPWAGTVPLYSLTRNVYFRDIDDLMSFLECHCVLAADLQLVYCEESATAPLGPPNYGRIPGKVAADVSYALESHADSYVWADEPPLR